VIQGRKATGLNEAAGLPKNKSLSPSSVLEAGFFYFCTRAGKEGSMQNSIMSRAVALGRRKKSTAMLPKAWRTAIVLLIALWAGVAFAAAEPSKPAGGAVPRVTVTDADRQGFPPTPTYVTAWPRKVEVAKPDPVLGDKPFQEIWAYNKAFAKRFKNLSPEGATEDFSPGAYALVFRVYKEVIFDGHKEQYRCEYDFYFDNSIRIPLSDKPTWVDKYTYPQGVTESYVRLEPQSEPDRQALRVAKPTVVDVKQRALILADGPLDGRFATLGIAYYSDLAPRLAMVRLTTMFNCEALAPKAGTNHFWLSLFGNRPYKEGRLSKALHGSYLPRLQGSFEPGPEPAKNGYFFRVPEKFYRAVLPKVTLAKALNDCIGRRYASTLPNKASAEKWAEIFAACEDMEHNGTIYNLLGGKISEGLSELGF
jgi:hypothetical protein